MKCAPLLLPLLMLCCASAPAADESAGLQARLEQMLKSGDFAAAAGLADSVAQVPPADRPPLLRLLARAHEGAGDPAKAVDALLEALAGVHPSLEDVGALKRLGRACMTANAPEAAVTALEYALAQYPGALERYGGTDPSGYTANRRLLDRAAGCVELACTLAEADLATGREGLRPEVVAVARQYPDAPGAQPLWVRIADEQATTGDAPGAAVTLLRVLSATGDRTRPYKTKLVDNQAYLDAISTAHSRKLLSDALSTFSAAGAELGTGEPIAAAKLTRMADLWHIAEAASYAAPRTDTWVGHTAALVPESNANAAVSPLPLWEAVIAECDDTPLRPVAQLVLGQWLQYRGVYAEAALRYEEAEAGAQRVPGLAQWLAFERGELALQTGRLAEAGNQFARCADAADKALSTEATLRLAECHECLGQWHQAREANQRLSVDAAAPFAARKRARLALARVEEAAGHAAGNERGPAARYVGQDRLTQGDWQWRGRDHFVLCAARGIGSLSGGALGPWEYKACTTDPARRIYWWHGGDDDDASMPCNHVDGDRGPRNWDDGGEKYGPGTGPDVVVDLPIADGDHNLSLYFVNDRNYYEPNRMYTVHISDAGTGVFLAAAPIRDSVSGVYLQFRVSGPMAVRVHVWRNLSMNALLTGLFADAVSSMPDWATLSAGHDELAFVAPAWERYRSAWQTGADAPSQRALLTDIGERLFRRLGQPDGARALETLAENLCGAGFAAQSIVLEDDALGTLSTGSQRQYGAALLRAVALYGGGPAPSGPGSGQHSAAYRPYALARLSDYAGLVAVPSSLVAPADLLELGHSLRDSERELARECFSLAVDGDLDRLPSPDLRAYAFCLADRNACADTLAVVIGRGEPYPRPEPLLRAELVDAYGDAGRLDEAEAQMELLMACRTSGDCAYFAAWGLVASCKRLNDPSRARRWAERILKEFPASPVAPLARRFLDKASH